MSFIGFEATAEVTVYAGVEEGINNTNDRK